MYSQNELVFQSWQIEVYHLKPYFWSILLNQIPQFKGIFYKNLKIKNLKNINSRV